ncbi:MAG: DNA repair protein RecO [Planctomycetes bacterium]|nr:DNA repair protein RecO [Planctomycetota bacterium]
MPRFKDDAICIRHLDWSETSQVVVLLTRGHGKVRGLAKGSKRMSPGSVARYSGGVELLTRGQIVGIIKTGMELATLTEWDLQEPYAHLRNDLAAQRAGLYAADLCNAMLADQDEHPGAFTAMDEFLSALAEPAKRELSLLVFQWRLLADAGYRPEVERDVVTAKPLTDRASYTFDARAGGLTATVEGSTDADDGSAWKVRRETVAALRAVGAGDAGAMGHITDESARRANRLLCVYLRAILDRALPTMGLVLGE